MNRIGLVVCMVTLLTANLSYGQSRPVGQYVVDQTSTISNQDKRRIDEICRSISDRTSGELLVCVVRTTNGRNARRFATDLFNRWGIGDRFANNGVLVFVAMQDRKAEIVLGDGIDSQREEAEARAVMSDYMMPQFKRGRPSTGIRIAVEQCANRFFRGATTTQENQPLEAGLGSVASDTSSYPTHPLRDPSQDHRSPSKPLDASTLGTAPSLEMDAAMLAEMEPTELANPLAAERGVQQPAMANAQRVRPRNDRPWFSHRLLGMLAGGLTVGGAGFGIHHLITRRRRPRNCEQCQQPMMLLDEMRDDEHLNSAERIEEQVGSVDYDIWVCNACNHALKLRYGKFFSGYDNCPDCRAKTAKSTSRTVRRATTIHTGLREIETNCTHCGYHDVTTRVIPRETDSHHSSGFSAGGSSFGGGGGGGGGSSSGGGASGSW